MKEVLRELDGQGRYIVRTHHTRTQGGQPITGQLLGCEPKGASDYCMHCGKDATNVCETLNDLAYGKDPAVVAAEQKAFEDGMAEILGPAITAFGCASEAKGGALCKRWGGSDDCAYTTSQAGQADSEQQENGNG
jgi:hypothetical protein